MKIFGIIFPLLLVSLKLLVSESAHAIVIDGNLSDWTESDRLDLPPYAGTNGNGTYNTFDGATNSYILGLRSTQIASGGSATIYLNTDQNPATGFKIFGTSGGVENFIQITFGATAQATLFQYTNYATGTSIPVGSLTAAYTNGSVELSIPRVSVFGNPGAINLLISLNNLVYLPADFSLAQYPAKAIVRPQRTNSAKRIAIIYSETTAPFYFDIKAYSQLFMAVQHQALMAGIPFDLISETQLFDVANLVNYDALVFPLLSHVKTSDRSRITEALVDAAFRYKIGLITSGDFLTNSETGAAYNPTPYATESLLFGITPVSAGSADLVSLIPGDLSHPSMKIYSATDTLRIYRKSLYTQPVYHIYEPVAGVTASVLAKQRLNADLNAGSAIIATVVGGRNVHFATHNYLGDSDLLWSALRWVVHGSAPGVTTLNLQVGRQKSLFISRNDVDEAKIYDEFATVLTPLATLMNQWKNAYNFVGTYYIDIGNNIPNGEYTDWTRNRPYYLNLIAQGNELGNHSYTHAEGLGPNGEVYPITSDTNQLTQAQLTFEFATSNALIQQNVGVPILGAAVPGNPDTFATAKKIEQLAVFDHLTGGFSGIDYSLGLSLGSQFLANEGAGFHGAFGFLTPSSNMLYLSPNMTPDFTIIQFRKQTPAQATQIWKSQFTDLVKFSSQPIVQFHWHDYGPTSALTDPTTPTTVAMYEDTIKLSYNDNAEFLTASDLSNRFRSHMASSVTINPINPLDVTVSGSGLGTFSLLAEQPKGGSKVIQSIVNWYAFDDKRVFLPESGGRFITTLGASASDVTHITSLPMRAKLISLTGNGSNLSFSFKGKGKVEVVVNSTLGTTANVVGASSVLRNGTRYTLSFDSEATHQVVISSGAPLPTATPTSTSTAIPTSTFTSTFTSTSTATNTPTATATSTATATITPIGQQATPTPTSTQVAPTLTATSTPITPTATFTATAVPTATYTSTSTATPTNTPKSTRTRKPHRTKTPTPTPTRVRTPRPTRTPKIRKTATPTATATATETATLTHTATPTLTATLTPTSTATSTTTPTVTATPSPTSTFTATSTATFTGTQTPRPTSTFTALPTSTATLQPPANATATVSVNVLGCDGVSNSGKKLDQCGVCGGDGTSCTTACDKTDLTVVKAALDTASLNQRSAIVKGSRLVLSETKDPAIVKQIKLILSESSKLQVANWELSIQIPTIATSCKNTIVCSTISNQDVLTAYRTNAKKLLSLNSRISRLLSKLGLPGRRKIQARNGTQLFKLADSFVSKVPSTTQVCTPLK